jgi:hypothetical protein
MLPGDIFASEHSWPELLEGDGWTLHSTRTDHRSGLQYELWTRPGKTVDQGASASLYYGGTDVLKVFTSAPPPGLREGQTYTRFGYWAATRFNGDHTAAAREVRHQIATSTASMLAGDVASGSDRPRAALTSADVPVQPVRPAIVVNGRGLEQITADALDALTAANTPPTVFVRAGTICRLRQDEDGRPLIDELRVDHARLRLAEVATWARINKDGGITQVSPPTDVVTSVLAAGEWQLPALAGVVELPVLRPDGTFALEHGHDEPTRLYHWHRGAPYLAVRDRPGPEDVAAAVALLDELLEGFPFDTTADRANAIGLMLTPLVRAIVDQVPMALVDAPEPGTGKGLLVSVVALVTMGRSAALMAWPASDEELEKKITAALMAGQTMVVWDNIDGIIRSGTLAAVLTSDTWQGRVLGASKTVQVPNRATWVCTGNNIDVGGDLARRCYRIRLDARQAQPWKRTGFRHPDLHGWVLEHRTELLHALCTLVRAWWVAGRKPAASIPAMGGYTSWVRTVGGILDHAGIPGFLGNLAEFHAGADRDAQSWEAFLATWHDRLGEEAVTVGDLVNKMRDLYAGSALKDALPEDLSDAFDSSGFAKRLGIALRKRAGRHYGADGLHIVSLPQDRRRTAIYSVTTREAGAEARKLAELPREPNVATCENAIDRGSAEVVGPVLRDEISPTHGASEPNNFRNFRTSAVTPDPRIDELFGPAA